MKPCAFVAQVIQNWGPWNGLHKRDSARSYAKSARLIRRRRYATTRIVELKSKTSGLTDVTHALHQLIKINTRIVGLIIVQTRVKNVLPWNVCARFVMLEQNRFPRCADVTQAPNKRIEYVMGNLR